MRLLCAENRLFASGYPVDSADSSSDSVPDGMVSRPVSIKNNIWTDHPAAGFSLCGDVVSSCAV
jgi:hypothetical protein